MACVGGSLISLIMFYKYIMYLTYVILPYFYYCTNVLYKHLGILCWRARGASPFWRPPVSSKDRHSNSRTFLMHFQSDDLPCVSTLSFYFIFNYILLIIPLQLSQFFPLSSSPPSTPPLPQAMPPPFFMFVGHAYKFFGYAISYIVLYYIVL